MTALPDKLSLLEIDTELEEIIEEVQALNVANEELPAQLMERFESFCSAYEQRADKIGHFVRMMEFRERCCRQEAARLLGRARAAEGSVKRTKSMVMYLLMKRGLPRLEGHQYTFRIQANSQDSVRITDESLVPLACQRIHLNVDGTMWETVLSFLPEELAFAFVRAIEGKVPDTTAIKAAVSRNEEVPGAEVKRGYHLRVA